MCSSPLMKMSDDGNSQQPVPAGKKKEEKRQENAGQSEIPALENRGSWSNDTSDSDQDTRKAVAETGEQTTVAADDDEEGFQTPTSVEHRIPEITECPPAPMKKTQSFGRKRRRSPLPGTRRCVEFDASNEVELIFRPETGGDDEDGGDLPGNKRARKGDDGDEGRL